VALIGTQVACRVSRALEHIFERKTFFHTVPSFESVNHCDAGNLISKVALGSIKRDVENTQFVLKTHLRRELMYTESVVRRCVPTQQFYHSTMVSVSYRLVVVLDALYLSCRVCVNRSYNSVSEFYSGCLVRDRVSSRITFKKLFVI